MSPASFVAKESWEKSTCSILGEKAKLYKMASAPLPIEMFLAALKI